MTSSEAIGLSLSKVVSGYLGRHVSAAVGPPRVPTPSVSASCECALSGAVHGTRGVLGAVSIVTSLISTHGELSILTTAGGTASTTSGASITESGL